MGAVLKNIGWLTVDKILRLISGLMIGVWIARHLGPEDFGKLSFAVAFVSIFSLLAAVGLPGIVVRELVRRPRKKNEIISSAIFIQLIAGIFSYVLMAFIAMYIRPYDVFFIALILIIGVSAIFRFGDVAAYWFESQVKSKYIVIFQSIGLLLIIICKIIILIGDGGVYDFAMIIALESVVFAFLNFVALSYYGPKWKFFDFKLDEAVELIKQGWPLLLSGLSVIVYMRTDQIMLAELVGSKEVGIYAAASRISESWYFIPMAIIASLFPSILAARDLDSNLYYEKIQKIYDLMVWMSLMLAIPITFFSDFIINTIYGNDYEGAGIILAIHIWGSLFVLLGMASGKYLIAENKQYIALRRTVAGLVSNVALNAIMIPAWGGFGAAIATVISYSIASFFYDGFSRNTKKMFKMKLKSLNLIMSFKRLFSMIY